MKEVAEKKGAEPILIGGNFTPTMHIPGCPCDGCIETRTMLSLVKLPIKLKLREVCLMCGASEALTSELERVKKQLGVAVEALNEMNSGYMCGDPQNFAEEVLAKMKAMEPPHET